MADKKAAPTRTRYLIVERQPVSDGGPDMVHVLAAYAGVGSPKLAAEQFAEQGDSKVRTVEVWTVTNQRTFTVQTVTAVTVTETDDREKA